MGTNTTYQTFIKYSLSGMPLSVVSDKRSNKKKIYRDISGDIISNESIEDAARLVEETDNYGPENQLITRCLQKFPDNTDSDVVAMKIGLIDITNSTHLSQHKSLISMAELCRIIVSIPAIDKRIAVGEPQPGRLCVRWIFGITLQENLQTYTKCVTELYWNRRMK